MNAMTTQRDELVAALRGARQHRPVQGTVYLCCEQPYCSVSEVHLRINEARNVVKLLQPRRTCPLCKNELRFYELKPR